MEKAAAGKGGGTIRCSKGVLGVWSTTGYSDVIKVLEATPHSNVLLLVGSRFKSPENAEELVQNSMYLGTGGIRYSYIRSILPHNISVCTALWRR